MAPTSWLTLAFFFAFFAPGIFFDLLRNKKLPNRDESIARESTRAILVSTWCSAVSIAIVAIIVAIVRALNQELLPSPRETLGADKGFILDNFVALAPLSASFVVFSLITSCLTYKIAYRNEPGRISQQSTWTKAFRGDAPEGSYPLVRVKMTSGTGWTGRIAHFSPDLSRDDRELVLAPPLSTKSGDNVRELANWGRVILPGDQIESISVQYKLKSAQHPDP
ncbi:DUF6338 family protein [Dietzia sp. SYD-A1]|uniref:DUF6338 family protein n=1 Tax=Dietzia sp. SYD-A1 TaxID=2780141 RepID=UPI001891CD9C|nr:DUF6338 family protein [Dietzia sp. SYD-A1]